MLFSLRYFLDHPYLLYSIEILIYIYQRLYFNVPCLTLFSFHYKIPLNEIRINNNKNKVCIIIYFIYIYLLRDDKLLN